MTEEKHNTEDLTKNQALVFGVLSDATGPLSAYTVLDYLRDEGFRAPLQVYRALDKLLELGLVHRLESLNAFVACRHRHDESQEMIAFAICDGCGNVREFADSDVAEHLHAWAAAEHFHLKHTTIELRGRCQSCADR